MSASAAEVAGWVDGVPQQCTAINEDILDALIKNLIKTAPPGTDAACLRPLVEKHLLTIFLTFKTPHHPPYALMIRQAITELDEEGGSNEEAISEFIKLKYNTQSWGYVNLLRHHLRKLKDQKEIFQVSGNRYKLSHEVDNFTGKVKKSKKRRRRGGKEECYKECKVSKSVGSSNEYEAQQIQNKEQQKQVTCVSRKDTDWGVEVNEEVRQVGNHEQEVVEDTSGEIKGVEKQERLLKQQKQEAACIPSQLAALGSEIVEQVNLTPHRECEGIMEVITPTSEDSNHLIAAEGQVLWQENENDSREQICEVSCNANKQIAFGFEVNGEVNQLCGQECENKEEENFVAIEGENSAIIEDLLQGRRIEEVAQNVSQIEEESSLQLEGQQEEREQSTRVEEREELKNQQFVVINELQQYEGITEVIDTLIQLEEQQNEIEEENRFVIEGRKEPRQQVETIKEQKEANCKHYAMIEDLQNHMEVVAIQVEEELEQMEEEDLMAIAGEKEETKQINETEDQQKVNCEKQGATTVSEDQNQENDGGQYLSAEKQFDGKVQEVIEVGKVPAIEQQEKPMEMQVPVGIVLEGLNVSKGAENLMEDQFDANLQASVIEKQVKVVGFQKQQQWQPEVNEQHLQLKEMGAEIVEWIKKIITPERPPKEVVGNKKCTREGETRGLATNLISSPAFPSLKQEQCFELLNMAVKMQGLLMEIMKSNWTAESSRCTSDVGMLESNDTGLSVDHLTNATAEITALPSCQDQDMVVAEPLEDVEISCSARLEGKEAEDSVEHASTTAETKLPLKLDMVVSEPPQEIVNISNSSMPSLFEETLMIASHCQSMRGHPNASESEQQDASSTLTVLKDLEEHLQHQELAVVLQPKEHIKQLCNDSTITTTLQLEEIMIENHQEKQPETHYVQSQVELQSEASEVDSIVVVEEAMKPPLLVSLDMLHFVPEQEALVNNKPNAEGQVENSFKMNTKSSLQQQHLQSEPQLANLVKIIENNDANIGKRFQPNVLQGVPKPPSPFGGDSNTNIFGMPQQQQQPMLLWHGQHKQMWSPLWNQTQLPSIFDTGSLFQKSLFQQPEEPLTISPMKPSALSGEKLQPFKPIELTKLMEETVKPFARFSAAKQMWPPQQVINAQDSKQRQKPGSSVGGYKRKLRIQDCTLQPPSPMNSDKKAASVVEVSQKKRRGRPPKQETPGYTPPPRQRRPKIRQTVPKKLPSAASDGDESLSSQSPSKQGTPGRPPKRVKVAPMVAKPIIPKNPF